MADINLTDAKFDEMVMKSSMPVVVDFWAPWCGPCRLVSPIIEELAKEYAGKVTIYKLNVDENPDTSGKFNVMSIPTVMFFKGGKPLSSVVGARSKEEYKRNIEELVS